MAVSITICNLALGDLRANPIAEVSEETVEARECRRYYQHCLDVLLDDYAWTFCKRVASLAQLADNERSSEYAYAYQLPSDCGQALRLLPSGTTASDYSAWGWPYAQIPQASWWQAFIVENGVLYSNVQDAVLEYGSNAADEADFPPLFREALRKLLASNLAVPLRDDQNLKRQLMQEAEIARQSALAGDMNRAPMREQVDEVAWARR
jgi:hypothetical protein